MEGKAKFNVGTNALTNTLHSMIAGIAQQPPVNDFGIIHTDYSLTTNTFPKPIPKTDYSVCRSVLYSSKVPLTETYVDGEHDHEGEVPYEKHQHEVKLPKKMRWLQPGDKVLVAWIANEAVVIDIVYDAKYLGENEPNWT